MGLSDYFCEKIAKKVIEVYKDTYPLLENRSQEILQSLSQEESKFQKTLERGEKEIQKLLSDGGSIDGQKAFWIFETY